MIFTYWSYNFKRTLYTALPADPSHPSA